MYSEYFSFRFKQAEVVIFFLLVFLFLAASIEMTLDRAIRINIPKPEISLAISNTANSLVLFHPNGLICQKNSRVDMTANSHHTFVWVIVQVIFKISAIFISFFSFFLLGHLAFTKKNSNSGQILFAVLHMYEMQPDRQLSWLKFQMLLCKKYFCSKSLFIKFMFICALLFVFCLFWNSGSRFGRELRELAEVMSDLCTLSRNYDGVETLTINKMELTKSLDGILTWVCWIYMCSY